MAIDWFDRHLSAREAQEYRVFTFLVCHLCFERGVFLKEAPLSGIAFGLRHCEDAIGESS